MLLFLAAPMQRNGQLDVSEMTSNQASTDIQGDDKPEVIDRRGNTFLGKQYCGNRWGYFLRDCFRTIWPLNWIEEKLFEKSLNTTHGNRSLAAWTALSALTRPKP